MRRIWWPPRWWCLPIGWKYWNSRLPFTRASEWSRSSFVPFLFLSSSLFLFFCFRCRVYIRRPDTTAVKWNAYLAPFAWNIWNVIALTIVIVTLTIAGIDAFSRRVEWLPSINGRPYSSNDLFDILFHVFGVFCGQGKRTRSLRSVFVKKIKWMQVWIRLYWIQRGWCIWASIWRRW